jgi:hypothetical protein
LFWKVKFITKQKMLDKVMEVVEETEEGVTDDDVERMAFRKMFKSSVMEALNARRSSCDQMIVEQAGRLKRSHMLRILIGGNNGNIINPTEENNVFVCTGWWFGRGMVRSAYWRRMAQIRMVVL